MFFQTGIEWLDAAELWFIEFAARLIGSTLAEAAVNYLVVWLPLLGLVTLLVWWRRGVDGVRELLSLEPKGSSYPPLRVRLAYYWRTALARLR